MRPYGKAFAPHPTLPCAPSRAGTRRRNPGAALRRALERGGARATRKKWSFLHISKPEIDLDPATDPYDKAVYAKAADNLKRMVADGMMMRDDAPCYYVYRLIWRDRTQTGLACVASLADYASNRIRKHELTTPVKEDDRVRQIEAINAQTGPVMIGYPNAPVIDALLAQGAAIRTSCAGGMDWSLSLKQNGSGSTLLQWNNLPFLAMLK